MIVTYSEEDYYYVRAITLFREEVECHKVCYLYRVIFNVE
jgi:hypothetical protein